MVTVAEKQRKRVVLAGWGWDEVKSWNATGKEEEEEERKRGQGMLALWLDAARGKPSVVNCDFALVLSISCLGSFTLNGRL